MESNDVDSLFSGSDDNGPSGFSDTPGGEDAGGYDPSPSGRRVEVSYVEQAESRGDKVANWSLNIGFFAAAIGLLIFLFDMGIYIAKPDPGSGLVILIIGACFVLIFGMLLGISGLVLGIVGLAMGTIYNKGKAIWGMMLSVSIFVFFALDYIIAIVAFSTSPL